MLIYLINFIWYNIAQINQKGETMLPTNTHQLNTEDAYNTPTTNTHHDPTPNATIARIAADTTSAHNKPTRVQSDQLRVKRLEELSRKIKLLSRKKRTNIY